VSSYLPKYVDPDRLLAHAAPHVKAGGVLVVHDFTLPPSRLVRTLWNTYTRAMNFIGRRFFPEWRVVFDGGLTQLIRRTDWFETWPAALERHGFDHVHRTYLTLGCSGLVWATKSAGAGAGE
jgi:demethylmenaquinone methyltransferase/2-methoxy-6-polyprenyl-1,4-benzoquinol methylase